MNIRIFAVILYFISFYTLSSESFTPGLPWMDTSGNVINAHGGGIIESNNRYYWFGEKRNSKGLINKVNAYSSVNLYDWKYEGVVLDLANMPIRHDLERPKVVYNKKNKEYVMWLHIELNGHYTTGKAGVAVSKHILGPYKFYTEHWPNKNIFPIKRDGDLNDKSVIAADKRFEKYFKRGQMFRDMTIFVDDDDTAYAFYESEDNASIQVAELSDDYKQFTGKYARILVGQKNEAPAVFKKNGSYFLITSGLHGYTPTDGRLSIASNIFGPWKSFGTPFKSDNTQLSGKSFHSQPTYVFNVNNQYIYMGDRWIKHDLTKSTYVWLPIKWDNDKPYITWLDSWNLKK
ncbi:glycoside hydrolase family 43 protein [Klebsiella oxytoca]